MFREEVVDVEKCIREEAPHLQMDVKQNVSSREWYIELSGFQTTSHPIYVTTRGGWDLFKELMHMHMIS